jgi:hypothetical protein
MLGTYAITSFYIMLTSSFKKLECRHKGNGRAVFETARDRQPPLAIALKTAKISFNLSLIKS